MPPLPAPLPPPRADWGYHRSLSRYLGNVANLPQSGIMATLCVPLAYLTVETVLVVAYADAGARGVLPQVLPRLPDFGLAPFELTAFALSLLLGFRTNMAFDRWNQGREAFSRLAANCRSAARIASVQVEAERDARAVLSWVEAYMCACTARLREDGDVAGSLSGCGLPGGEADRAAASPNPGLYCLRGLGERVLASKTRTPWAPAVLGDLMIEMERDFAACESLLTHPTPLFYTHHAARFLVIWLGLLPFGLVTRLGWQAILAEPVVAFALLGIDEIGMQLEEPFGILPLESATDRVASDIDMLLESRRGARGAGLEVGS